MSAGCLLSGGPHLCKPCAQHSCRPGSCRLPFSTFPCHPSWTCGGERSPIHCGVVKSERPRGHSSPGSWQWPPCHPSWGWLWKSPHGRCCLRHSWICHPEPQRPSWRETQGTPFVGVQHRRRDECLFQASSTAIAHVVLHDYYVIQVGEVISPCIGTEGAEGQLYQLVPQVNLQSLQACGGVKLSK